MNRWERLNNMIERNGRAVEVLRTVALVFSTIVSAISIGIVVWKGGALSQDHSALKDRVTVLESNGSRNAAEHIKLDDMRERMTNDRLAKLDAIVAMIPQIQQNIAVIDYKLDDLKSSLDVHKRDAERRAQ